MILESNADMAAYLLNLAQVTLAQSNMVWYGEFDRFHLFKWSQCCTTCIDDSLKRSPGEGCDKELSRDCGVCVVRLGA